MDFAPSIISLFSEYWAHYSHAVSLMGKYKAFAQFDAALQTAYSKPAAIKAKIHYSYPPSLNLMTWLIKPWQWVTKYPNFIKELKPYTPQSSPDYEYIDAALEALNNAIETVNERKRVAENREIISELGSEIEGWDVIIYLITRVLL